MAQRSVSDFLNDLRLLGTMQREVVDAVRARVHAAVPGAQEVIKYGGILFSSPSGTAFCGVFAYREHVSLEFSHGAHVADTLGHLEGAGKGRRHLKLRSRADLQAKAVDSYLPLALQAAREHG